MLKKAKDYLKAGNKKTLKKKWARKKTSKDRDRKKKLESEIQNKRKIERKQITNGYEGWCGTRNKGGVLS